MNDQQQQAEQQTTTTTEPSLLHGPVTVAMGADGVQLDNIDECFRFASTIHNSRLAPKGLETPQAVMLAIFMGLELGMKPMTAIQNIAVINGRPSIWGDAALAICRQSQLFVEDDFNESIDYNDDGKPVAGTCTCRRFGGRLVKHTFSMTDAQNAGLLEKNTPWRTYTRRMLQMRARSWALRDCFPDLLLGMRLAEEQQDCTDDHKQPEPDAVNSLSELTDRLTLENPEAAWRGPKAEPKPRKRKPRKGTDVKPIHPTPKEQQANAEIFCERIANAVSADNLDQCEADIVKCIESDQLTQTQSAELAELIAGKRGCVL
jgi:hypothetical protein